MTIALLLGNYEQHLDHLAPLAALLDLPLYITEKHLFTLAKQFYPHTKLHYLPMESFDHTIATQCSSIISCHPKPILDAELYVARNASKKQLHSIWLPHGNSDKGENTFYMESLQAETHALLYGEKICDFLKTKKAFANLKRFGYIGNYRYTYFKHHQNAHKYPQKTILFAPSWQPEDKTHLLTEELNAIQKIQNVHVLVKPHPNTFKLSDASLLKALLNIEENPNMTLLKKHPTIYPLLASIDLLITDISSIGYDFLAFDRPLILLHNKNKHHMNQNLLDLNLAGPTLYHDQLDQLETLIEKELSHSNYSPQRQRLYNYTFESPPSGMDSKSWIDRQLAHIRLSF